MNTATLRNDIQSGLVVFLVALPLCLGIAVASGATPFAGIISGVIGGIVVGIMSGSHVSVSGPAAGLIAIILTAITQLGFDDFLLALVLAGGLQLLMGVVKAGTISSYFPNSVIEGMLAAIGIIIIVTTRIWTIMISIISMITMVVVASMPIIFIMSSTIVLLIMIIIISAC